MIAKENFNLLRVDLGQFINILQAIAAKVGGEIWSSGFS